MLDKETINRIEKAAYSYACKEWGLSESEYLIPESKTHSYVETSSQDYIAGATAEAERAKVLVEALKGIEIISRKNNSRPAMQAINVFVTKALTQYSKHDI